MFDTQKTWGDWLRETGQALLQPDTLSEQHIEALYIPFSVSEHYFHNYWNFCYLKEEAINLRLTRVVGLNWSKRVTKQEWFSAGPDVVNRDGALVTLPPPDLALGDDGEFLQTQQRPRNVIHDKPLALVHGYVEICGIRRYEVGGDVDVNLGREPNTRRPNTTKAAYTDFLKRASRQFGIGLYLTELQNVKDHAQLRAWLNERYPSDWRFFTPGRAQQAMVEHLIDQELYSDIEAVKEAVSSLGINPIPDTIYETTLRLEEFARG